MLIDRIPMAEASMANSEHSFSSRHAGGGGGTPPHAKSSAMDVGERLHSHAHGHICNHARCAANNPQYALKATTPPKKFLVAKKHAYGGLEATKSVSCDHSSAFHSLTNSMLQEPGKGSVKPSRASWNGAFTKVRTAEDDKNLYAIANSVMHHQAAHPKESSEDTTNNRKGAALLTAERKSRPTSPVSAKLHSSSSGDTQRQEQQQQQKSRLSCTGSLSSPSTNQGTTPSPVSATRREEDEDGAAATTASSPTASVGSNHCSTEMPSSKEIGMVEQSSSLQSSSPPHLRNSSQSPASKSVSSHLQKSVVQKSKETIHNSPSTPSSRPTRPKSPAPSIASNPSRASPRTQASTAASPAPARSATTTPAATNLAKKFISNLKESSKARSSSAVSSSPSVASSNLARKFITNLKESSKARQSAMSSSTSVASSNLARQFITNLKESSKARSSAMSSSMSVVSSEKKPSRISKSSVSPAPLNSSSPFAPPNSAAANLARKFISDLQSSTAARRAKKGVRAIELRGGKAQTFSTTTVTSWNMTTTTVQTSVSTLSENSPEKQTDSGLSRSESPAPPPPSPPAESTEPPSETTAKEVLPTIPGAGPDASSAAIGTEVTKAAVTKEMAVNTEAATVLKFGKKAKTTLVDGAHDENSKVSLKHGEIPERRLSEEWMTNHALEPVQQKIADKDHRVKVLVHAFESLATTLSDSDGHCSDDNSLLKPKREFEALSATPIAA